MFTLRRNVTALSRLIPRAPVSRLYHNNTSALLLARSARLGVRSDVPARTFMSFTSTNAASEGGEAAQSSATTETTNATPATAAPEGEGDHVVYIGNMSYDTVDPAESLNQLFASVGEVPRFDISRFSNASRYAGRFRGFVHAHFKSKDAADKAIALDGTDVNGRRIRIAERRPRPVTGPWTPSRPTMGPRGTVPPSKTLHIANLPYTMREPDMRRVLEQFKLESVVMGVKDGRAAGFAHVTFETQEEADVALRSLAGAEVGGRTMFADYARDATLEGDKLQPAGRAADGFPVLVRNIPYEADPQDVNKLLQSYGEIVSVVPQTTASQAFRGNALVYFKDQASANDVVGQSGITMGERELVIETPQQRDLRVPNSRPTNTLFVKNFPYDTPTEELQELFREWSPVSVRLGRNQGQPLGFAHVEFRNTQDAQDAAREIRGRTVGGRRLFIDFAEGRSPFNNRDNRDNQAPFIKVPRFTSNGKTRSEESDAPL